MESSSDCESSSLWRILWDTSTILLVYIAIVIPYYIGFGGRVRVKLRSCLRRTSTSHSSSILYSFLTAYSNDEGTIVKNHYMIARRYIRSYFWIDLVRPRFRNELGDHKHFQAHKDQQGSEKCTDVENGNTARLRFIGSVFDEFRASQHSKNRRRSSSSPS